MRTKILVTMLCLTLSLLIAGVAGADTVLFSSTPNDSFLTFSGSNFTFTPSGTAPFANVNIIHSTPFDTLVPGGYGIITGTFAIGAVTTVGTTETAPAIGLGTFVIHDAAGDTLSAQVNWINVRTDGNAVGALNWTFAPNLSNLVLTNPGNNPELLDLFKQSTFEVGISWANPIGDLNALKLAGTGTNPVVNTAYSGTEVTAVPIPPSALLLGSGLLGLVGLRRFGKS